MAEVRINLTKTAWNKFLSCSPSPEDKKSIKEELVRLGADPGHGTRVPFSSHYQWKDCDMIWAQTTKKWYIVYRRDNPDAIDVLLIDEAK